MGDENTFGKKLQKLRRARGLTQEKLAELAGVHEKHISKLELGTYKPSFKTLSKVLSALGLKIDEMELSPEKISYNDNYFFTKSMQILNNATDLELKFYYGLLKQAQKGLKSFNERKVE